MMDIWVAYQLKRGSAIEIWFYNNNNDPIWNNRTYEEVLQLANEHNVVNWYWGSTYSDLLVLWRKLR